MKLLDILLESSFLDSQRDRFKKSFKSIMGAKGRSARLKYTEKLIRDILKKDEIKFLVIKLQKKK